VLAGLGGRDADGAREGLVGQRDPVGEGDRARLRVDRRDPQPRVGELVRQQPEAGDDRRPAPVARAQLEDLDRERVAGARATDEDRAGDRVDAPEVERRDVGGCRVRSSWPPEASRTSSSTTAPSSTSCAGSIALSQTKCASSSRT
jgi:hypothetical protein